MHFADKDKHDTMNLMLGLSPERTTELEQSLTALLTTSKQISIADTAEAIAPQLQTPEESFYIGYLIGAITHDASA